MIDALTSYLPWFIIGLVMAVIIMACLPRGRR